MSFFLFFSFLFCFKKEKEEEKNGERGMEKKGKEERKSCPEEQLKKVNVLVSKPILLFF